MSATNATILIHQRQAYAASLTSSLKDNLRANLENKNQHLNQQGNCIRTGVCSNSDVGQGTLGNDNSVTGFADQSTTNTTTANAPTSGPAVPVAGSKGDPGAQGLKGDQGPPGTIPDNSVTTSKLADGAVTTSKIANHTITPNKITGISKLVFAQCTIRIERDSNGGICSVPQAEISDMVFVGASNSHQGSGGLILHAGFVESAGQVRLIARIFDVSNLPVELTWQIILFHP